jgi:hypothetical protein
LQRVKDDAQGFNLAFDAIHEALIQASIKFTHFDLLQSLLEGFLGHCSGSLSHLVEKAIKKRKESIVALHHQEFGKLASANPESGRLLDQCPV